MPAFYNRAIFGENDRLTRLEMPYRVMQISMTTSQRKFQTFQEHLPEYGAQLTTALHSRLSPRFLKGGGGCTQARHTVHDYILAIIRGRSQLRAVIP